jgi:hypothetical protein
MWFDRASSMSCVKPSSEIEQELNLSARSRCESFARYGTRLARIASSTAYRSVSSWFRCEAAAGKEIRSPPLEQIKRAEL